MNLLRVVCAEHPSRYIIYILACMFLLGIVPIFRATAAHNNVYIDMVFSCLFLYYAQLDLIA